MARPTKYTENLTAKICERIACGESLRGICLDPDMPGNTTVKRWLNDKEAFRAQYAHAREAQADKIFDECLEIADDASKDYTERQNKDGSTYKVFNIEHVQRARLRIDTRKWMVGKLRPKKYGDKLDIDQRTTHEAGDSLTALMSAIDGKSRTK